MASATLNLSLSEKNYSIENNTSDISWSLSVTSVGAFNGNNWQCPWIVRYNNSEGAVVASGNKGFAANTTTQLASGTIEGYKHNDNGSATITLYAHYYTDAEDWMVVPKEASTTVSIKLTDIPRATSAPNVTGYIESVVPIILEPKSSSFPHSIKLTVGSSTKYVTSSGGLSSSLSLIPAGTSFPINVTFPTSYYKEFTGKELKSKITVTTYTQNSTVGSNTIIGSPSEGVLTIQCNPNICSPSFDDADIIDINQDVVNGTGDNTILVRYMSTAQVTLVNPKVTNSNDDNVTLSYVRINGVDSTSYIVPFPNVETNVFDITMVNSRGFSTSMTVSNGGRFVEYIKLDFAGTVARTSPTTGEAKLTYKFRYYPYSLGGSGSPKNTITLRFKYRERYSGNWITPDNNEITGYSGASGLIHTYGGEYTLPVEFDYKKQYEIVVYYNDLIASGESDEMVLVRGLPTYWWDGDSFNVIGKLTVNDEEVKSNAPSLARLSFGYETINEYSDTSNTEYYDHLAKLTNVKTDGKLQYGDYKADTVLGRLVITNTTLCEVTGAASGYGDFKIKYRLTEKWDNANYSELIQSDYSVGASFRVETKSSGATDFTWNLPLPSKVYKLDPTKTYYIYLTAGKYDGIMSRSAWLNSAEITVKKIS
jgi:hypothetical protein